MPRRCAQLLTACMLLGAVAVAAGCSAPDAPPPRPVNPTPAAPARTELPQATLPDGLTVSLEVPETDGEKSEGLMYRASLPENQGMLFLLARPSRPSLWMKDTWVALDMVFLDAGGTVVDVLPNRPPCRDEPCPQYSPSSPASAVLELAAGTAARHGVAPGTILTFANVRGYPAVTAGSGSG